MKGHFPIPCLLLLALLCMQSAFGQLNGAYTIGGAAPDYPDFSAAVNALIADGVAGPVVFDVRDGTYNEQISIPAIVGASAVNTITFRSQSMDPALVLLTHPADVGGNYTVFLSGAQHIAFDRLSIERSGTGAESAGRAVFVGFGSTHCTFSNNIIRGIPATGIDPPGLRSAIRCEGSNQDELVFLSNRIENGVANLYIGAPVVPLADQGTGIVVQDNVLVNAHNQSIIFAYQNAPLCSGNRIESGATALIGITLAANSLGIGIEKNVMLFGNGGTGIEVINHAGSPLAPARIVNNAISISGGFSNTGIRIRFTTDYLDVLHNSLNIEAAGATSGFDEDASSNGTGIALQNNVIRSQGPAISLHNPTAIVASDYNDLFPILGAPVGSFNGLNHNELCAWRTATGWDLNSVSVDPLFASNLDLRPAAVPLDNIANPLAAVTEDLDGAARNPATPDMGAYEFSPLIYNNAFNQCLAASDMVFTGCEEWRYAYRDRQVVAALRANGNPLGTASTDVFLNAAGVRQDLAGIFYLDRNWHMRYTGSLTAGDLDVRLYYLPAELVSLSAADPLILSEADLGLNKYDGANENCTMADNVPAGYAYTPSAMVASGPVYNGYVSQVAVADLSELYLQGLPVVLGAELLDFSAMWEAGRVRVQWQMAAVPGSLSALLQRSQDGSPFEEIARIPLRQGLFTYHFDDERLAGDPVFYRLQWQDENGDLFSSSTVELNAAPAPAQAWRISPNPVQAGEILHITASAAQTEIHLLDLRGQFLRQYRIAPGSVLPIETTGLAPGMYLLRGLAEGRQNWQKLVVD